MNPLHAQTSGLLSVPSTVINVVIFKSLTDPELQMVRLVCKRLNSIAIQNLIQRYSTRSESEPNPLKKLNQLEKWIKLSQVKAQQTPATSLDIDDMMRMQKMMNNFETKTNEISRQIESANAQIRHMINNIPA